MRQSNFAKVPGLRGWAIVAVWALLAALPVRAQTSAAWNTVGPAGGTVNALLTSPVVPSTLYAGTAFNGVFVSTDGGGTWTAANAGMTPASLQGQPAYLTVYALVTDQRYLYAATSSGLYYTPAGNGVNWLPLAATSSSTPITSLAYEPVSNRLFAANAQPDATAATGVWVSPASTPSAPPMGTWQFSPIAGVPAGVGVAGMTIMPAIYVPTSYAPAGTAVLVAAAGNNLYASPIATASPGLNFALADGGGTFASASSTLTALTFSADLSQLYVCAVGSVWVSGNPLDPLQAAWATVNVPASQFQCNALTAANAGAPGVAPQVLLGTDLGAFAIGVNDSAFFATGSPGPSAWTNAFTVGAAIGSLNPTVFAGTGFGVASAGAPPLVPGATWSASNGPSSVAAGGANARLNNANVVDVALLGTTVYAATNAPGTNSQYQEVFASSDGGASWSATGLSAIGPGVAVVALAADNAHLVLYAATSYGLYAYTVGNGWTAVAPSTFANIQTVTLAVGSTALIVGTDNGVYTLPLSDVPASALASFSGLSTTTVTALLVSAGGVYAGGYDQATGSNYVYATSESAATSAAATWSTFGNGSTGTNTITSLASSAGGLLVGTDGGLVSYATATSLWVSANSSANASQQISDPVLRRVTSLYSDGVYLYAATASNGIFVSPVGTTFTWTPYNGTGAMVLPALNVKSIRGSGALLYAGTGAGLAISNALIGTGPGTPTTPTPVVSSGSSGGGAFDPLSSALLLAGILGLLALRRPR